MLRARQQDAAANDRAGRDRVRRSRSRNRPDSFGCVCVCVCVQPAAPARPGSSGLGMCRRDLRVSPGPAQIAPLPPGSPLRACVRVCVCVCQTTESGQNTRSRGRRGARDPTRASRARRAGRRLRVGRLSRLLGRARAGSEPAAGTAAVNRLPKGAGCPVSAATVDVRILLSVRVSGSPCLIIKERRLLLPRRERGGVLSSVSRGLWAVGQWPAVCDLCRTFCDRILILQSDSLILQSGALGHCLGASVQGNDWLNLLAHGAA